MGHGQREANRGHLTRRNEVGSGITQTLVSNHLPTARSCVNVLNRIWQNYMSWATAYWVMRHFYCLAGVWLLKAFSKRSVRKSGKNKTKIWAFKVINWKELHLTTFVFKVINWKDYIHINAGKMDKKSLKSLYGATSHRPDLLMSG